MTEKIGDEFMRLIIFAIIDSMIVIVIVIYVIPSFVEILGGLGLLLGVTLLVLLAMGSIKWLAKFVGQ